MPEVIQEMIRVDRREQALIGLASWISALPGQARPLGAAELVGYDLGRGITDGWRLDVAFDDRVRRLDLLLDRDFPHTPPRVGLVDRPDFLTWPHVERDGVLCALPEPAEVSPWRPGQVAAHVLGEACRLIEDCIAGRNEDDLRDEFLSYWGWATTPGCPTILSLVDPAPPTRLVRVWRGAEFFLIGESDAAIQAWLEHRFPGLNPSQRTIESATLLWLTRPILPREYPRTAAELLALARTCTDRGGDLLEELAVDSPGCVVTLLAAPSRHGPCLAGVTVAAPRREQWPRGRGSNPLERGFRKGKVPPKVLAARYLGGTVVDRSTVSRVDPVWIHGRGRDPRLPRLRAAKAAIVGCGSLGGAIALKLAQAGVGHLLLVDPETLAAANVGRHPLGLEHVGRHKALALAEVIGRSHPHINAIEGRAERWEVLAARRPELLASCDLIISTVGHWRSEGALNSWHIDGGRRPTVVYGWTEAHACAGHAVAIGPTGGCLQCGLDETGFPLLHVTEWRDRSILAREPACGAVFQPYGPIELTHIEALIAELALDCLLTDPRASQHRIWAAREETLRSAGGTWTSTWRALARNDPPGGCTEERPWPNVDGCRGCSLAAS
jgi:hypothetical protein